MSTTPYLLSLLCGIGSEVFLFSRGEWDYHSPRVVQMGTSLAAGSTFLFWGGHGLTFAASFRETLLHATAILAGLFGSMTIYRLFFHPLRAFPGPIAARISTAWIIQKTIPNFRFFLTVSELHEQYGDFVRISGLYSFRNPLDADHGKFRTSRDLDIPSRCCHGCSWSQKPNAQVRTISPT
jgi:tryprostatin B 6-hydroxylase